MTYTDITGDIGPLFPTYGDKIPMYSFDRPSLIIWQSIYDAMRAEGCTHAQAVDWLQSKQPRWDLDRDLGRELMALGQKAGLLAAKDVVQCATRDGH